MLLSKCILKNYTARYPNHIQVYTDASKQTHGVGCAFYIPALNVEKKIKLNPMTSIFSAKTIAIIKACQYADNHDIKKINIMSDSLSVLKSFSSQLDANSVSSNSFRVELKILISELTIRQFNIIFTWVKAHIGLQNNEKVDELAKDGSLNGEEISNDIGLQDCISISKYNLKNSWKLRWKQYCVNHPTSYTLLHPEIPTQYWHKNQDLSRYDIVTINRLKFGHACFPSHLFKIDLIDSDLCEICNIPSDLNHIFFACNKFNIHRNKLYI
ncbi:uncharacterized protein LOC126893140 [Diabrotica virgifera virgifera]|uniref:RNase H type-1 domain-containing protein n=1 Tax=Diabrotica virgifera virgifera TaxID=50390 RepID=A0ABM5L9D6_DIAVI|nr:uncharacterized protein LOC126893140 [Diabrotica virgifera virgifera]